VTTEVDDRHFVKSVEVTEKSFDTSTLSTLHIVTFDTLPEGRHMWRYATQDMTPRQAPIRKKPENYAPEM